MNGNSQFDWLDEGCLQEGARLKFNLCCCFQYNNTPYVWQGDTHRSLLSWVAKGCEICWTNIMSLQNWWKNEGGALALFDLPQKIQEDGLQRWSSPQNSNAIWWRHDDVTDDVTVYKAVQIGPYVCTASVRLYVGGARLEDFRIRAGSNGIRAGLQPSVSHREEPTVPQTPLTHYVNHHFMLL